MTHGPLAVDVGHAPVVTDAVARLALVFGERLARRTHESTVAWKDDAGVGRLAAELVDDVRRRAPVGVDHTALNPQHRSVVASPLAAEKALGQRVQAAIDRSFQAARL